jgi:ankyrin repeat protein
MSQEDRPATRPLPAKPDLRHLKDQAKEILESGKAASLAAGLFEVARMYGFASWPKLKQHVISLTNAGKLKDAITQNDLKTVQDLLSAHPELRKAPIGYGGDGPLTWAAECRGMNAPSRERLGIVEWLIADGADVHEGGDGPLMRAALDGSRIPMMELLVRRGADVNAAWHGWFPIIFAPCETLDRDALRWLLEHGADPNCGREARWKAAGLQRPDTHVGTALEYVLGTYVRSKEDLSACVELLHKAGGRCRYDEPGVMAAILGDAVAVREFIERDRALVEKKFPALEIGATAGRMLTLRGATLLHVAAEFGQAEVARVLLDLGADVNARALIDADGVGGQTAIFHAATQNGDFGLEVVRLLISRGADVRLQCRVPGHYESTGEVFEGDVITYARRFPGGENETVKELLRAIP